LIDTNLDDLKWLSGVIALILRFFTELGCFAGRLRHSGWLQTYNVRKILSCSNSLPLLAITNLLCSTVSLGQLSCNSCLFTFLRTCTDHTVWSIFVVNGSKDVIPCQLHLFWVQTKIFNTFHYFLEKREIPYSSDVKLQSIIAPVLQKTEPCNLRTAGGFRTWRMVWPPSVTWSEVTMPNDSVQNNTLIACNKKLCKARKPRGHLPRNGAAKACHPLRPSITPETEICYSRQHGKGRWEKQRQ